MSSANQQNNSLLRSIVNFALLAGMAAGFATACVSSSDDTKGTGGNSAGGEGATGGSSATNGGTNTNGGSTGSNAGTGGGSSVACTFTTGLVTGNLCTVDPGIFTLDATGCSFGDWNMSNNSLSGGLAIWGGLAQDCTGGAYHVTGSYAGFLVANTGGNAGFTLFYNVPTDAGIGCSILNASNYKGITLDIDNVTIPNNQLIIGMNTADGNKAEVTISLTAGKQSKQIAWGQFKKGSACGPAPETQIASIYYVFPWMNDTATHTVDATFTNVGFYNN